MKKNNCLLGIILALFMTITTSAYANERRSGDVPKLVKKMPRTEAFQFNTFGFGWKMIPYEFVSLKDIPQDKLNDIEKNLLNVFVDAAFCFKDSKVQCCYWVKDDEGKIGLIKFDGSVIVPPLAGRILQGPRPDLVVVGEQTLDPVTWFKEYEYRVRKFNGLGLGHFGAVVDDIKDEKKIHACIPAGKYDDIMIGIKGASTYFFVAKIIDGEMKWGVVDREDKEVMPISAKGIYKKKNASSWLFGVGGKWKASETMDMKDIENMVRNEEKIADKRRADLARTMTSLGNALIKTGTTIEQIQQMSNGGTSEYSEGSGSVGGSLESQYRQWENRAKANYNSLTNLGSTYKKNGKDVSGTTGQGMSSSNYTQMKKSLREAQQEMKKIRQKASKSGINIPKSQYEDVSVSY